MTEAAQAKREAMANYTAGALLLPKELFYNDSNNKTTYIILKEAYCYETCRETDKNFAAAVCYGIFNDRIGA